MQIKHKFKTYVKILQLFGLSYPIKDEDREQLDKMIRIEYQKIKDRQSTMTATQRAVIKEIVEGA